MSPNSTTLRRRCRAHRSIGDSPRFQGKGNLRMRRIRGALTFSLHTHGVIFSVLTIARLGDMQNRKRYHFMTFRNSTAPRPRRCKAHRSIVGSLRFQGKGNLHLWRICVYFFVLFLHSRCIICIVNRGWPKSTCEMKVLL